QLSPNKILQTRKARVCKTEHLYFYHNRNKNTHAFTGQHIRILFGLYSIALFFAMFNKILV
ncbi:MAG: hypothetical protein IJM98_03210, partial [Oscillospiraceae bacterium]|nr:hypothetical protein [Oscillospiraceae bacterium]